MKKLNNKEVSYYEFMVWAGDGFNTDIKSSIAEVAIDLAIKFSREFKTKVWVELTGKSLDHDTVKLETIFVYDFSKIEKAQKKHDDFIFKARG
jgi:hypothetical protein